MKTETPQRGSRIRRGSLPPGRIVERLQQSTLVPAFRRDEYGAGITSPRIRHRAKRRKRKRRHAQRAGASAGAGTQNDRRNLALHHHHSHHHFLPSAKKQKRPQRRIPRRSGPLHRVMAEGFGSGFGGYGHSSGFGGGFGDSAAVTWRRRFRRIPVNEHFNLLEFICNETLPALKKLKIPFGRNGSRTPSATICSPAFAWRLSDAGFTPDEHAVARQLHSAQERPAHLAELQPREKAKENELSSDISSQRKASPHRGHVPARIPAHFQKHELIAGEEPLAGCVPDKRRPLECEREPAGFVHLRRDFVYMQQGHTKLEFFLSADAHSMPCSMAAGIPAERNLPRGREDIYTAYPDLRVEPPVGDEKIILDRAERHMNAIEKSRMSLTLWRSNEKKSSSFSSQSS